MRPGSALTKSTRRSQTKPWRTRAPARPECRRPGVLGGYILLFPTNRVTVLISWFVTQVPAFVAIGLWFVFQLINGLGVLGSGSQAGGVAYAAHIGGFIAGLLLIKVFEIGRRPPDRYYEREF